MLDLECPFEVDDIVAFGFVHEFPCIILRDLFVCGFDRSTSHLKLPLEGSMVLAKNAVII